MISVSTFFLDKLRSYPVEQDILRSDPLPVLEVSPLASFPGRMTSMLRFSSMMGGQSLPLSSLPPDRR